MSRANPINAARCGTVSGYSRHRKRGEDACDACKIALAADRRARRRRRGEVKRPNRARLVRRSEVLLPPPATLARCREGCGRLVWHFDRGLCGACAESEAA